MSSTSKPSDTPASRLGRVGIWSGELRFGGPELGLFCARELEAQGWPAAWTPGGADDKVLDDIARLLEGTSSISLASGIVNIWKQAAGDVAAWWRSRSAEHQARVMIGVGVSHGPLINEAYGKPLATTRGYLERLRAEGVPAEHVCLAALGPKMLELSVELSAGAHPYLVTVEHTAGARALMGPDALLAPEQGVILETDPGRARELARQALRPYMQMPNYLNSWLRLGFSSEDLQGSDRLIDGLFAWGDAVAIRDRVKAHLDAGADHVCLQVVNGPVMTEVERTRANWEELASALL